MSCSRVTTLFALFALAAPLIVAGEVVDPVVSGPGTYRILADDGVIRFPFEIFRGDIRFQAKVNGRPVRLLLDDGFMWDQLLFWGGPEVEPLGLEYDGEILVGDPDDAEPIPSRTASGITLTLPGVEFSDQTAVITPAGSGVSSMWSGSVGQVSATFFKHFVVEFDFDDMVMTLIEPGEFEYEGSGAAVPIKRLDVGASAIPGKLGLSDGRTVALDLMLDLGYNDQLQIATKSDHEITAPKASLPAGLGRNIQGVETLGEIGRLPRVEIGGLAIPDVLVGYVSAKHTDHTYSEVMIGLGLLSRFNFVYDYPHRRIFFEPNKSFSTPFEFNMSGLRLTPGPENDLEVVRVYPDSPASEAKLRSGDRVLAINGRPAADFDIPELRTLLRQEGATIRLRVARKGEKSRELSLTLRRLI